MSVTIRVDGNAEPYVAKVRELVAGWKRFEICPSGKAGSVRFLARQRGPKNLPKYILYQAFGDVSTRADSFYFLQCRTRGANFRPRTGSPARWLTTRSHVSGPMF